MPLAPPAATAEERRHLEEAHHELCTSLTSLRSNLELARLHAARRESAEAISGRLREMEDAVDRLERLARSLRVWHGAPVTAVTSIPERGHERDASCRSRPVDAQA